MGNPNVRNIRRISFFLYLICARNKSICSAIVFNILSLCIEEIWLHFAMLLPCRRTELKRFGYCECYRRCGLAKKHQTTPHSSNKSLHLLTLMHFNVNKICVLKLISLFRQTKHELNRVSIATLIFDSVLKAL